MILQDGIIFLEEKDKGLEYLLISLGVGVEKKEFDEDGTIVLTNEDDAYRTIEKKHDNETLEMFLQLYKLTLKK